MKTDDLRISKEEKFLINILFKKIKDYKKKIDFKSINYDLLVKIASSHLILPLLYVKLEKNYLIEKIPLELKNYLKEIFKINENRNQRLIFEAKELKKILDSKKIKFTFFKGIYNIIEGLYERIGERMVRDIDFLIYREDFKKLALLLNNNNYNSKYYYKIWKTKHQPGFVKKGNISIIEPHTELLVYRKRKLINPKDILKKEVNGMIKICIYNFQINDYGYLKASYSYRTIYDYFLLKDRLKNFNICDVKDKYFRSFILIMNELGISNHEIKLTFKEKIYLFRFRLKRYNRLFYWFDDLICKIIIHTPKIIMKIVEFLFNKEYRFYAIKKLGF